MRFGVYLLALITHHTYALGICDDFLIKVTNKTATGFIVTDIFTENTEITPDVIQTLPALSELQFSIINANRSVPLHITLSLYSIEENSQHTMIDFQLKDKGLYCQFEDNSRSESFPLEAQRKTGVGAVYTIG